MIKEIKLEKGDLVIRYYGNESEIFSRKKNNDIEKITLTFIPNALLTPEECKNYLAENDVIEEVKKIVAENYVYYKNFEIDFDSQIHAYNLNKGVSKDIASEYYVTIICNENIQIL